MTKYNLGLLDRLLGFAFWLYFNLIRLVNRKLRCPAGEGGIHLWVVRDGYVCRDCGAPMGRVAPGSDGVDR